MTPMLILTVTLSQYDRLTYLWWKNGPNTLLSRILHEPLEIEMNKAYTQVALIFSINRRSKEGLGGYTPENNLSRNIK
jgi:hypothetical protein